MTRGAEWVQEGARGPAHPRPQMPTRLPDSNSKARAPVRCPPPHILPVVLLRPQLFPLPDDQPRTPVGRSEAEA